MRDPWRLLPLCEYRIATLESPIHSLLKARNRSWAAICLTLRSVVHTHYKDYGKSL